MPSLSFTGAIYVGKFALGIPFIKKLSKLWQLGYRMYRNTVLQGDLMH